MKNDVTFLEQGGVVDRAFQNKILNQSFKVLRVPLRLVGFTKTYLQTEDLDI